MENVNVNVNSFKQVNIERNSSKGNQLKWFDGKTWYKADFLGYEALSEYLISKLLRKTNVPDYVDYDITELEFQDMKYVGCRSKHFLGEGYELVTLEKLFRRFRNIELTKELVPMEVKERIQYVVDGVKEITGLEHFGTYITMLLELDALFLNEDRHFNNIAVIANPDGTYDYCPVFDNGSGLFSDTMMEFGLDKTIEQCYEKIESKPFSRSFDEQMDAAEELYGYVLKCWFTVKDIQCYLEDAKQYYSPEIINRVEDVLRWQLHKYQYLQIKTPLKDTIEEAQVRAEVMEGVDKLIKANRQALEELAK